MAELALRPAQVEQLAFYIANEKCMDLSDPGTGKTPPTCVYIQYLYKDHGAKTIWGMPKSLLKKNKKEMHRFTDLTDEQVVILDGTAKQIQNLIENSPNAVVFLMSFARFRMSCHDILKYNPKVNALIFDEFHMGGFKTPKSKASQVLMASARKLRFFLIMTGTLIAGKLDSCYTAIKCIEPRYYYDHYSFLAQHALLDDFGTVLEWINHEKLGRIFMRHAIRKTFEEVHGEEKYAIVPRIVDMDSKTAAAYQEFEENAMLEVQNALDNGVDYIDAVNNAVFVLRCRQLMSHPETFNVLKEKDLTGKDEALEIEIEDHYNSGEPLVIFSALIPEQERIFKLCQKKGLRTALINSNTSGAKRALYDEQFQEGKLDCIVGSPATMSVGFNWGHVNHIIFASIDYQDDNFVQAIRRGIRDLRKTVLKVTVLSYGTKVENAIFSIVDRKSRDKNKVDSTYKVLSLWSAFNS